MGQDVFRQLEEANWDEIIKRLTLFAAYLARIYFWRTGRDFNLAKGWTPEDVVQHVILKTIEGIRRWDPARGALEPWLRDQVKSVVDALYHSQASVRETSSLNGEEENVIEQMLASRGETDALFAKQRTNPEDIVVAKETTTASERIQKLLQTIDGQEELEEIVLAILDGCEAKPRFLAAELGTSQQDINNRMKRLKRRALKEVVK